MNTIIDTMNVAEIEGLDEDDNELSSDMTATHEADKTTMDFHIQMRSYTMRDFEQMVVHAAAQQLLRGHSFKSEIAAEVKAQADKRLNAEIGAVMADAMKTTIISRGSENVTLAQMIGMESRAYLTQPVDDQGRHGSDGWGTKTPRLEWLAKKALRDMFKAELDAAFAALKSELSAAVSKQIEAAINERRESIATAIGYEIRKAR